MKIKRVNCSKYLGIYVDDQLNWKYHIECVYKKTAEICRHIS